MQINWCGEGVPERQKGHFSRFSQFPLNHRSSIILNRHQTPTHPKSHPSSRTHTSSSRRETKPTSHPNTSASDSTNPADQSTPPPRLLRRPRRNPRQSPIPRPAAHSFDRSPEPLHPSNDQALPLLPSLNPRPRPLLRPLHLSHPPTHPLPNLQSPSRHRHPKTESHPSAPRTRPFPFPSRKSSAIDGVPERSLLEGAMMRSRTRLVVRRYRRLRRLRVREVHLVADLRLRRL